MLTGLKMLSQKWNLKMMANNKLNIKPTHNNVHIAGRGSVVRQLRILASQFRVLRTGTLSEIRPDNMYQPLHAMD
jgi:hypothetical protein